MTIQRQITAFFAVLIALLAMVPSASAGLYFSINGSESASYSVSLSDATPTETLLIRVRDDGSDSGGTFLDRFGFKLTVDDVNVAKFTEVTLLGSLSSPNNAISPSGNSATASAVFNARVNISGGAPGTGVALASFKLTGLNPGSATIRIVENTTGNNDFQTAIDGATAILTDKDRRTNIVGATDGFSGDGTTIGFANTGALVSSTITAVPEPASSALVAGGLAVAFMSRWRRRKQARAAMPA